MAHTVSADLAESVSCPAFRKNRHTYGSHVQVFGPWTARPSGDPGQWHTTPPPLCHSSTQPPTLMLNLGS